MASKKAQQAGHTVEVPPDDMKEEFPRSPSRDDNLSGLWVQLDQSILHRGISVGIVAGAT